MLILELAVGIRLGQLQPKSTGRSLVCNVKWIEFSCGLGLLFARQKNGSLGLLCSFLFQYLLDVGLLFAPLITLLH